MLGKAHPQLLVLACVAKAAAARMSPAPEGCAVSLSSCIHVDEMCGPLRFLCPRRSYFT